MVIMLSNQASKQAHARTRARGSTRQHAAARTPSGALGGLAGALWLARRHLMSWLSALARPPLSPALPVWPWCAQYSKKTVSNYDIRRLSVDYGVPLVTNLQVAELFSQAVQTLQLGGKSGSADKLDIRSMQEHYADTA
jgi:hypothetical protein